MRSPFLLRGQNKAKYILFWSLGLLTNHTSAQVCTNPEGNTWIALAAKCYTHVHQIAANLLLSR